jgi:hypothetical protein
LTIDKDLWRTKKRKEKKKVFRFRNEQVLLPFLRTTESLPFPSTLLLQAAGEGAFKSGVKRRQLRSPSKIDLLKGVSGGPREDGQLPE